MDIGEQDFHHVKRDQSLLVEFPVFPTKLIELIDLCLRCNANNQVEPNNSTHNDDSKFSANLDITSGIFSVIESNRFKQLTHIALQLRPGNDAAIKSYLSSRLVYITSVANKKTVDLTATLDDLNEERMKYSIATAELHDLRLILFFYSSCIYME